MNLKVFLATGLLCAGASLSAAQAAEYTVEVTPDHRKCYVVNYIPATYLVNTQGKLVRGVRKEWSGEYVDGGIVVKRIVPAVYIEKRTLLEADHYSLRPGACR